MKSIKLNCEYLSSLRERTGESFSIDIAEDERSDRPSRNDSPTSKPVSIYYALLDSPLSRACDLFISSCVRRGRYFLSAYCLTPLVLTLCISSVYATGTAGTDGADGAVAGANGGDGGPGGTGVSTLDFGGSGGDGGDGGEAPAGGTGGTGGNGGNGGSGAVPPGIVFDFDGLTAGGSAGDGGDGGIASFAGSVGGGGGKAGDGGIITIGSGATLNNSGMIQGGNAGKGGDGGYSNHEFAISGDGGIGGLPGYVKIGTAVTVYNSGTIRGGRGGYGGNGGVGYLVGTGGSGASGIDGGSALSGTDATISNSGSIIGGKGGLGGYGGEGSPGGDGGDGGNGGDGISGSRLLIDNSGEISAGDAGNARSGGKDFDNGLDGVSGTAGSAGIGIHGSDLTVTNSGTINDGIIFTGGINRLTLESGSLISGNVVAFGAADSLSLGGSIDATFDTAQIGSGAQYQNFGIFEKHGSSTWTLSGAPGQLTPWTLSEGRLLITNEISLGAAAALALDGGTLAAAGALSVSRAITLGASGGGIDSDGNDVTLSGVISGTGGITKQGSGTLTLSNSNTFTGAAGIDAGTLQVTGALASDVVVNAGATLTGNGSVGGITVDGAGIVAPGTSPGTLSTGSLILGAAAILDFELDTAGEVGGGVNDLIVITGNLTLDGTLSISDVGGFGLGSYTLMTYTGSLTDNGLDLPTPPAGQSYRLETDGNTVELVVATIQPPQLVTPLTDRNAFNGVFSVNIDVAPNFDDPDNQDLSFSASGLPSGLSISTTGVISGTVSDALGDYTVNVLATDTDGASIDGSFRISVLRIPDLTPAPEPESEPEIEPTLAELLSVLLTINGDGNPTEASFAAGLSNNDSLSYQSDAVFSAGSKFSLMALFSAPAQLIGQQAGVVIAIRDASNPAQVFMLTSTGEIVPFDGVNIIYFTDLTLQEDNILDPFAGESLLLSSNEVGVYEIYIGVQLMSDFTLIYTGEPLRLEVRD